MKVLIIGGTGFIGRHLASVLSGEHEIFLFHRGNNRAILRNESNSIIGDRRSLLTFRNRFEQIRPDVIVDLIPYFAQDAWDVVYAFGQLCRRVIAISSGDVYRAYEVFKEGKGPIIAEALTEESALRKKLFPYRGLNRDGFVFEHYEKILVELILQSQREFQTTILRLGALYGAFDSQRKLREYLEPMLTGQEKIVMGRDKANWKWTRAYVRDVVHAIRLTIEQESAPNQLFNVGNMAATSQLELLLKLKELTGWTGNIHLEEGHEGDDYSYRQDIVLNTDKIRRQLGYRETYSWEEGLLETIDFERSMIL